MNKLSTVISSGLLFAGLCMTSLSHAGAIIIDSTDDRPISNVQCAVEFSLDGLHYYDYHNVAAWPTTTDVNWGIDPSRCSCDGTECRGDCLYESPASNGSGLVIMSKMDNPKVYQDMYVDCRFEINSACHYDWEYVGTWDGSSDVRLILNGWNGVWDGECWGGDFLHH